MPEELEWSATSALRGRIVRALLLAFGPFLLSASVLAVEADDVPVAPQPTTAQIATLDSKKKVESPPTDVGADLAEKADAKPNEGDDAVVVDLGDGQDFFPQSKGTWTVSPEEVPPPSAFARTTIRHRADPEWARAFPEDSENGIAHPLSLNFSRAVKRTDPERVQRWALAADDDNALDTPSPAPRNVSKHSPMLGASGDAPRFASGGGLDSDAAEIVSNLALSEKDAAAKAEAEPAKPATSPVETAKTSTVPTEKGKDPLAEALLEKMGGDPNRAGKKPKGKNKKNEPEDPEARFNELIAQIERNKKLLELVNKNAPAAPTAPLDDATRRSDPHARTILDILKNNTPTGTVSGIVTDATGKQLTHARVRITDQTESVIDAPLPDGFWCEGRFASRVISGPVKVEVYRGRFCAPQIHGVQVKPNLATPIEIALNRPTTMNFAAQGWYLADLDMGLRLRKGERAVWLGAAPELRDLVLAAQAEGIQIIGVPVPLNDPVQVRAILDSGATSANVLVLPAFSGPRHAFHGNALGLGVQNWQGLPKETSLPEVPLRDAFEEIHARGGLAIFKDLNGEKTVDVRRDILSLIPRLEQTNYFGRNTGNVRLYAANELPFDTVTGPAYDAIAFDGSPAATKLWFNLLNHDYSISVIGAAGGSLEGGRLPYGQTFINIEGKPTRENVLSAIKAGRTSISFGPAAFCKISERDKGPGAILPADGRQLTLQIQAYASMAQGAQLDKIEIIRNGEVVHSQTASDGEAAIHGLNWPVSETTSAWYVVHVTERRNTGAGSLAGGGAWTSPIYFRGAAFAAPEPMISKVSGRLRRELTPTAGTVTAIVPGQPPRQVATDGQGNFTIKLPSSGSLVFAAEGCEPQAVRVFEHPMVQRAMGALVAESRGSLSEQFANPTLFPAWRLMLSELEWNIALTPGVPLIQPVENADTKGAPGEGLPTPQRTKDGGAGQ